MPDITIVNVVASATLETRLDLNQISEQLDGSDYDKKRFPGLIYRISEPQTAILLFSSGKAVCTGARSIEDVHRAISVLVERLQKIQPEVSSTPPTTIQNIVATTDLGSELRLNNIAVSLGLENVEYEPDQFPGLVYRVSDPKVVALLFGSGKVVCTGAKKVEDVERALKRIIRDLEDTGFL